MLQSAKGTKWGMCSKSCNLKVRTTYMCWRSSTMWKNCWEGFIWMVTPYYFSVTDSKVRTTSQVSIIQSVVPYRFFYFFDMCMVSNIILWYSHVLFKHILTLPIIHAVMIGPITQESQKHEFLIPEVHLLPVFYMYSSWWMNIYYNSIWKISDFYPHSIIQCYWLFTDFSVMENLS